MGFDSERNISGKICVNHFEEQYLIRVSQTVKLKVGAIPTIFNENNSNFNTSEMCQDQDGSVCEPNNDVNLICACRSDCEKISLVKEVKDLRESISLKNSENDKLKRKYALVTQALVRKNAESRRKMTCNRTKIYRLQETKRKLIVTINDLKKRNLLTEKEHAQCTQITGIT